MSRAILAIFERVALGSPCLFGYSRLLMPSENRKKVKNLIRKQKSTAAGWSRVDTPYQVNY